MAVASHEPDSLDEQSRSVDTKLQTRPYRDEDINDVIEIYSSHTYALLPTILRRAILTPSSLWMRGALLPVFAYFMTMEYGGLTPWVVGAASLLAVPALVAVFIWMQLTVIIRKGTESDLSAGKLPAHFSDSGSRFFVLSDTNGTVGCIGVRNRTRGQAELFYLAIRPRLADPDKAADVLLETAVAHARRAGFFELIVRLNSAELVMLEAARRAGLGQEQLSRINNWFYAHRLSIVLRKGGR